MPKNEVDIVAVDRAFNTLTTFFCNLRLLPLPGLASRKWRATCFERVKL